MKILVSIASMPRKQSQEKKIFSARPESAIYPCRAARAAGILNAMKVDGVVTIPIYCVVAGSRVLSAPYVRFRALDTTTPSISKFLRSHLTGCYEFIKVEMKERSARRGRA
jgi:hypothetical protein